MNLLLAITGASGVGYGERLLRELAKREDITVHLVISDAGKKLVDEELTFSVGDLEKMADTTFEIGDLAAPPASGSVVYDAMVIVPCSMSTLSKIATGISDNLITRAAAVSLKESRELLVVPRETPLSTVWLENMTSLSREGVTILPAAPGFYHGPEELEDMVDFVVGKILDNLGLDNTLYKRWD